MIAVAHLVNATHVIPQLYKRSFCQDTSTFKDIFNEPCFVEALEVVVHIVSDLPESLQSAPRARKHFTSWSCASYYDLVMFGRITRISAAVTDFLSTSTIQIRKHQSNHK